VFDIWIRAVTRPRLATYEGLLEEAEDPSLSQALKAVAVAGLIAGTVFCLAGLATGRISVHQLGWPMAVAVITYCLVVITVAVVIGFIIHTAILLAVSKALGGQGNLGTQSYLLGASTAPVIVLAPVLVMVAQLGSGLAWATMLYSRYLELLGLCAAHKYGWRRGVVILVIVTLCYTVVGECLQMALGPPT
jgi:hypothetical protein